MAYPSSIDAPGGTAAQGTSTLTSPDHAQDHRVLGSAVINIENKLGIGAGSAAANQVLVGSGVGTAAWGSVWNNAVLGTPAITGGTITNALVSGTFNNAVFGTPTLTLGSDTAGDLFTRSSAGTVNRIAAGSLGQVLKGNGIGTVPSFQSLGISGSSITPTGTQTITSNSYVPLANGTVSVPVPVASLAYISANSYMGNNGAGDYSYMKITIGGTQIGPEAIAFQAEDHSTTTGGVISLAVGTYSAIINGKAAAGTVTYYQANISYLAFPS